MFCCFVGAHYQFIMLEEAKAQETRQRRITKIVEKIRCRLIDGLITAQHSVPKEHRDNNAPDWWESARFQGLCVAWSWSGKVALSRTTHQRITRAVN